MVVSLIFNYSSILYFLCACISFTYSFVSSCSKKKSEKISQTLGSAKFDKTQEGQNNLVTNEGQKKVKFDNYLSNVELLVPNLPGGCNDDNAAKEAMHRHKTNEFFPKLEIQKRRIVNSTTKKELLAMIAELPPHPPKTKMMINPFNEKIDRERREKWKSTHVHWNDVGIVFIVRANDLCRSKDEGVADTVDSPERKDEESDKEKVNSEMAFSEGKLSVVAGKKLPLSKNKTQNTPTKSERSDRMSKSDQAAKSDQQIKSDQAKKMDQTKKTEAATKSETRNEIAKSTSKLVVSKMVNNLKNSVGPKSTARTTPKDGTETNTTNENRNNKEISKNDVNSQRAV